MPDERALAFIRDLERADEEVAATLAELDELAGDTEAVRRRATAVSSFFERLPGERVRLDAECVAAEKGEASARAAVEAAEREAAEAEAGRDERRVAAAKNAVVRTRDALHMAERHSESARAERAHLDNEAAAAEREAGELVQRAGTLAGALRERPRLAEQAGHAPAAGLDAVGDWASGARAALFVARGSLANERDALVRQANELGTAVLGEPVIAARPAEVARRLERAAP